MPRGILYVASRPVSAEREAEYNQWYDEVHLSDVCALPGIVAGRRYAPVGDDGPYVALYDIESDDLNAVLAGLMAAVSDGTVPISRALQTNPLPEMRLLELVAELVT
jgi:hypothetical protein